MNIDGDGGDTGAADDLLGGGAGGDQGGGDQGGDQGGGDAGAGGGDAVDPEFYGLLSAQGAEGDNPSNRDWIKSAGFKDMDGVVKALRDNIKAVRDSGRVKVPGEDASDEDRAAFARAIGVPENIDGYEIKAPDGIQLNEPLIGALRESALKHGAPKGAFEGLVSDFIQAQLDEAAAESKKQDDLASAKVKEWGAGANEKLSHVNSAARHLGFSKADMQGLRNGLGADRALDLLAKLGEGMAEDTLMTGGRGRFGVTPAEAQSELDKLNSDPEHMAALDRRDPGALARRQRLIDAVAAGRSQKAA
ncbi:hypothetical protein [Sphingomonas sp. LaA6.9]|uniref:hypothetical protein n=1 Tax=Sphingomonas sp. LaA6.9 TaxID=2919914 RepID=UPI001F5030F3|nr:hypothetical protein [Sphingomonas sp. LaA6.9]MCJ8158850.1 hypothetical protein [Sphingomonas sp. LaA6.9]